MLVIRFEAYGRTGKELVHIAKSVTLANGEQGIPCGFLLYSLCDGASDEVCEIPLLGGKCGVEMCLDCETLLAEMTG
jgi:hypothetical protein